MFFLEIERNNTVEGIYYSSLIKFVVQFLSENFLSDNFYVFFYTFINLYNTFILMIYNTSSCRVIAVFDDTATHTTTGGAVFCNTAANRQLDVFMRMCRYIIFVTFIYFLIAPILYLRFEWRIFTILFIFCGGKLFLLYESISFDIILSFHLRSVFLPGNKKRDVK